MLPVAPSSCRRFFNDFFSHLTNPSYLLLLVGDRPSRTFARARVGLGALAADGQTPPVTYASVTAYFNKAFDIKSGLAAQVAFHDLRSVDNVAKAACFIVGQIPHARVGVDARLARDSRRAGAADAKYIGKPDFNAFFPWQIDAGYTCHILASLSLSLFMFRLGRTDYHNPAFALDNLAMFAHRLN
jgi:hypothetical protein